MIDTIKRKKGKKEWQTFRPHMGALFNAIDYKINSNFFVND